MKIIAGLGNIGKEYDKTRHNIGFMVADELARRWNLEGSWRTDRNALFVEYRAPEKVFLLKPTTYMNLSGNAVGPWAHFYNIAPEDVAVVHDDMDLPLGTIRIRKNGGHPVHEQQAVISHVLQPFAGDDKQLIEEAVKKMADALELWLKEDGDLSKVMQQFNTKPAKAKKRAEKEAAEKEVKVSKTE